MQAEYDHAGKLYMGCIVPNMGHCNGVAVYPSDAALRMPKAMHCTDRAWDYDMKDEMIRDCHDASHILWHAWGVMNGRIHPHAGPAPDFSDENLCRQMPEKAVLAHRSKNPALIDYLWRRHKK